MTPLEASIVVSPQGSAKIAEVVEAVMGEAAFPFKAVRIGLVAKGRCSWISARIGRFLCNPQPTPEHSIAHPPTGASRECEARDASWSWIDACLLASGAPQMTASAPRKAYETFARESEPLARLRFLGGDVGMFRD